MLTSLLAVAVLSPSQAPDVQAILAQVDSSRLRATVERLASFHTRNTLSPNIFEAAEWLAGEYRKIPKLQVEVMKYTVAASRRVPEAKEVVQVVAVLPGRTDRRIVIGGHMDSLNLQADAATGRAPGANDDASGTALALEAARIMAGQEWNQTIVFCGFTGEEQGLLGSRALAVRAKTEGWKLEAMLNNDMVGNSSSDNGLKEDKAIRVFSEEHDPTPANAERPPHFSRELARLIEWIVRRDMKDFRVKLVLRRDRFGRGGDHTPFVENGFSAVRFCQMIEEFSRQHNDRDLTTSVDWSYLANSTQANLASLVSLASAGPAPTNVRYNTRQAHDTILNWRGTPGTKYAVYWRETSSNEWQGYREVGEVQTATIEKVNKDHHFFAVGAVGGIPVPAG
ncbi:MAG TPA: M20/M25/M40 family metallo-hydrolase [Fimbriimonadaceae bacterium]|nr:M20/M25/M40 family metallo-hydrolase [Fimbriimonadaceae bacterium]